MDDCTRQRALISVPVLCCALSWLGSTDGWGLNWRTSGIVWVEMVLNIFHPPTCWISNIVLWLLKRENITEYFNSIFIILIIIIHNISRIRNYYVIFFLNYFFFHTLIRKSNSSYKIQRAFHLTQSFSPWNYLLNIILFLN